MALTKIGATLGGSADIITVTQTGHGLLVGRPVRMTDVSGTPTYAYATAAGTATADAIGIIIAKTTDTLTIALGGRITVDDCVPTGDAGTVLFLQVAAGLLAADEPDGNTEVSKPMAVITVDGSEMIMVQQRGEVISTAGISIADGSVTNAKLATSAITGAPDLGGAPATDDTLLISDTNDSAALKEITVANLFTAPAISGNATAATQAGTDDSTRIATTAHVKDVKIDDLTAGDDNTDLDSSTNRHGLLRKLDNTTTNFLRGDGTWAAAGGGNLVLVGTAVASSSSTLDITGLDSTYDTYMLVGSDVRPSNQGVELSMRLGDSSGFDSGASDYSWYAIRNAAGSSSYVGVNDAADSRIAIAIGGTGADANEGAGFVGWLHSPGDGTSLSIISGNHSNIDTGNNLQVGTFGGMRRNTVITVDRVQIFFSAGTITSGRFTVLGVKHA